MPKHTPKHKHNPIIDTADYASAALGMLDPGVIIQPMLDNFDDGYLRNWIIEEGRRGYRVAAANPSRRAKLAKSVQRYRVKRGRAKECGDFSMEQWEEIKAEFDNKCAYCGKIEILEIEHVIPISQNGKHTRDNIVPACRHCNATKNGRTPEQAGMVIRTRKSK